MARDDDASTSEAHSIATARTLREGSTSVWSRLGRLILRISPLFCAWIAIIPLLARLRYPTLQGDDVTRVVDLIDNPFRSLIFLPFAEHVAPLFQLVSWVTWQMIGHDVRWAPLGFCVASAAAWVLLLALTSMWLYRETGSRVAALVAVAIVAQSPLTRETAWWYSSSSFAWALSGIIVALLGASGLCRNPRRSLLLIAIGSFLGPAGTTIGIMAAPLASLRALLQKGASNRLKLLAVMASVAGLLAYDQSCHLSDSDGTGTARAQNVPMLEPVAGLGYAITVPGRMLWPSTVGVPASWLATAKPQWAVWGAGIVAFAALAGLAAWPRARWNRRLILLGAAMIYISYALTYIPRVCMLRLGRWNEVQLLYEGVGRYHVLPLLGLATIVGTILSSWPWLRRCDARPGLPSLVAGLVGLVMLVVQYSEASYWNFFLKQLDQGQTLAAVHHLGNVAREEGIPKSQLVRLIDPATRPWNESLMVDRPSAFPLMKLVVGAPEQVSRMMPDDEARARLRLRLTPLERLALASNACASLNPARPEPSALTVAVARPTKNEGAREVSPGHYTTTVDPAHVGFEFDPTPGARFLLLPGLKADQDVAIYWCDGAGNWRPGQVVRWLQSAPRDLPAIIDLDRQIHLGAKPLSRIAIQFTRPGSIALDGPPRLLR